MSEHQSKLPVGVFVYRPANKDGSISHLMANSTNSVKATTKGTLFLDSHGYSEIVANGKDLIEGELCFYDELDILLPIFDYLEDFNHDNPQESRYVRIVQEVETSVGDKLQAYMYVAGEFLSKGLQHVFKHVNTETIKETNN